MSAMTPNQQGDAAEHFVAGMIGLAGLPVIIMPNNWPDYDLLVSKDGGDIRVQVKLVNDSNVTPGLWAFESFNNWDQTDFWAIVRTVDGVMECWLIPTEQIRLHHRLPTIRAQRQERRCINWGQVRGEFSRFQDNWALATEVEV